MSIVAIEQLAALPPRARLMGVDLGTKTIGLALSDVERRIATPLLTIERTKFMADAKAMLKEIERHQVVGLALGLPLNMDGGEGARAQATRAFARNLAPLAPSLAIILWDERLSTAAVERALIAQDASRSRRAAVIDRMAAAYILQGALDRLRALPLG